MHAVTQLFVHPGASQMLFIALGGVMEVSFGGVKVYINQPEEEAYIETSPGYDRAALNEAERMIVRHGFEVMIGAEADEEMEGGRVRHWLAQTWFEDDNETTNGEEMVA